MMVLPRLAEHMLEVKVGARSGQDGFALVAVICGIGIIALLMVTYIAAAHSRLFAAFTASQRARAEALADFAVNSTIFELLGGLSRSGLATGRFGLVGIPVSCKFFDGSTIGVSVSNESGKVDLNAAKPALIEALLMGAMSRDRNALGLARSILHARRTDGMEGAKTAFDTVLQLGQIPGINRRLLRTLVPLVTVHSRSPGLNARVALPSLLAAVSSGTSPTKAEAQNATFYVADVLGTTVLIEGVSVTNVGIGFSRVAIVEFLPGPPASYRIREWREGFSTVVLAPGDGLPAC